MDFLDVLNQFNGDDKIQKKESVVKSNKPEVTFVMTACGRPDLMERTLDSFMRTNKHPIKRYIITEDSGDKTVFEECKRLNQQKYGNKLEFIFNEPKLGQVRSIDLAYSMVDTEYVFHCEEDWEFYKPGFIEASMIVLKDEKVLQAWIRPKSDKILNPISEEVYEIGGIRVRDVKPVSFFVPKGGPGGKDLTVRDYMGFSWNPGLKRMSDYMLLKRGYLGAGAEHSIDAFYRSHKKGFKVVSISTNDDEGYVKHIGWGRRADDPRYGLDKKDIETAKAEREQAKAKELEAKRNEQQKVQTVQVMNPKISIVMQAYLGDYPGSRADSVKKFRRAVESFLLQEYKNGELVIVSDGCDIVHNEYINLYKDIPSIKYVYVSKNDALNMYQEVGGKKYYRGVPRKMGVSACTGELITYMDSDDYLHPKFLHYINVYHNLRPDADWMINGAWYDHSNMSRVDFNKISNVLKPFDTTKSIEVKKLGAQFVESRVIDGLIVSTPWLLTHKAHCITQWVDTFGSTSEDVDFSRRLRATYKNGFRYEIPTYFRCHYTGLWDI